MAPNKPGQTQNAQQREKAKAVREQTRHGLMEQKWGASGAELRDVMGI
jgi:hypothetical protein